MSDGTIGILLTQVELGDHMFPCSRSSRRFISRNLTALHPFR